MLLKLLLLAILSLIIDLSDEWFGIPLIDDLVLLLISENVACILNFTNLFFDDSKFGFELSYSSSLV